MVDPVAFDEYRHLQWEDEVALVEVEVFSPPEVEAVSYLCLRVGEVASCLYLRKDFESSGYLLEVSFVSYLQSVAHSAVGKGVALGLGAALPFPNEHMDRDHQTVVSHRHGWYTVPSMHHGQRDLPQLPPTDDDQ